MKKIFILMCILFLFSNISCKKFLTVIPNDKAYESGLFSDVSGFRSGLADVYIRLNNPFLYGREMKYGFMETLVGLYDIPFNHTYYTSFQHSYGAADPMNRINAIWEQMYICINEVNIMLQNVENLKEGVDKELIKGELYGLRAFCHFELLKLFGPVISQEGINAQAIPYRLKVDINATRFSTAAEVIKNLKDDLALAKIALEKDPFRTTGRVANNNDTSLPFYNSLIDKRGCRMNYYAVESLQALVAQWAGNAQEAADIAEQILSEFNTNQVVKLSLASELFDIVGARAPVENIFSLINKNARDFALSALPRVGDTRGTSTESILFPDYDFLVSDVFDQGDKDDSPSDFRYTTTYWFRRDPAVSNSPYKFVKYYFDEGYDIFDPNFTPLYETKLISIHQLYMIAAEYYATTNPAKAIDYLNKVRLARNIITPISYENETPDEIMAYIFREKRKEYVGEGIMFSEYKRLYRPIDRWVPVAPRVSLFKFPLPIDEQTYNPQ